MSEMEVFYGTVEKVSYNIPEGMDIYDFEQEHNLGNLLNIDGQLYEFISLKDLDGYGFGLVIPPSDKLTVMCLWYNGGAGVHEVIEETIIKHFELSKEPTQ